MVSSHISRDAKRLRNTVGFTLLEVVLAIGLCGAVMALLATAIDLYLVRVDTSRTQVETAELARALLTKIGNDLRAVRFSSSSGGASGSGAGSDPSGSSSSSGGIAGSGFGTTATSDLGIYGTLTELRVDRAAERSWRQVMVPATDLVAGTDPSAMPLSVEYYFEQGRTMDSADLAAGGVAESATLAGYTGLYRRQTPTAARLATASTFGGGASGSQSNEPAELLAPEVVQLAFMYSDGLQWYEEWDSSAQQALPAAVEITLTLFCDIVGSEPASRQIDEEARRRDPKRWIEYRLLVRIPQIDEPQELNAPAVPSTQSFQDSGSGNGS